MPAGLGNHSPPQYICKHVDILSDFCVQVQMDVWTLLWFTWFFRAFTIGGNDAWVRAVILITFSSAFLDYWCLQVWCTTARRNTYVNMMTFWVTFVYKYRWMYDLFSNLHDFFVLLLYAAMITVSVRSFWLNFPVYTLIIDGCMCCVQQPAAIHM